MKTFPFPDKAASMTELERDLHYPRIPVQEREHALNKAWDIGAKAAKDLLARYPGKKASQIAETEGLVVEHVEKDHVVGKVRYFSEYYSNRKKIILYTSSIRLWAKNNKVGFGEACELILAHEMFHYLECTYIGLTSQQYTLPRIQIGGLALGKVGIRALSEIGAHGFARTFYEEQGLLPQTDSKILLQNRAVNEMELVGRERVRKIFEDNPLLRLFGGAKGDRQ